MNSDKFGQLRRLDTRLRFLGIPRLGAIHSTPSNLSIAIFLRPRAYLYLKVSGDSSWCYALSILPLTCLPSFCGDNHVWNWGSRNDGDIYSDIARLEPTLQHERVFFLKAKYAQWRISDPPQSEGRALCRTTLAQGRL